MTIHHINRMEELLPWNLAVSLRPSLALLSAPLFRAFLRLKAPNLAESDGVIYQLTPNGAETIVRSFGDPVDGFYPTGLIRDASDNFYGTAEAGGYFEKHVCKISGCGVVFELTPSGAETVIYSFTGSTSGGYPGGGLVADAQGNFYGETYGLAPRGRTSGMVFKVTPAGVETVLHQFGGKGDGFINVPDHLVMDAQGNVYGTTNFGGVKGRDSKHGGCRSGCGTVFEISAAGVVTILHNFTGFEYKDGAQPRAD